MSVSWKTICRRTLSVNRGVLFVMPPSNTRIPLNFRPKPSADKKGIVLEAIMA
jgi:hypothetical protein